MERVKCTVAMATFQEIINSGKPVLVDFFAEWCGPCQTMSPIIQDLKRELGDNGKILKVDIDKNPSAAAAFQVKGVPTFVIFKHGKSVWRKSGALPKSELLKAINQFT